MLDKRSGPDPSPEEPDGNRRTPEESVPATPSRWVALVAGIRRGDEEAVTELYKTFGRGVRYSLCRALGAKDLDDRVHDTFVLVLQSIQRGDLREPDRLMGFIRTVVRRQIAAYIEALVDERRGRVELEVGIRVPDHRQDPERTAAGKERARIMQEALLAVAPRDREILTRFYIHEQTQEQICREMELTENQFRLIKSRAKARFGELGKKRLSGGWLRAFSLREKSAGGH